MIKAISNADFTLVELKGTPHCKVHGAMNRISEHNYWRCLAQYYGNPDGHEGHLYVDRVCNAGCIWKRREK